MNDDTMDDSTEARLARLVGAVSGFCATLEHLPPTAAPRIVYETAAGVEVTMEYRMLADVVDAWKRALPGVVPQFGQKGDA